MLDHKKIVTLIARDNIITNCFIKTKYSTIIQPNIQL